MHFTAGENFFPAPVSTAMKTLSCLAKRMINLGKNYETEYGSAGEIETAKQQIQQDSEKTYETRSHERTKTETKTDTFYGWQVKNVDSWRTTFRGGASGICRDKRKMATAFPV